MAITEDKPKAQAEEEVFEHAPVQDKLNDDHIHPTMPETLRGMSDDELRLLEKGIVRKIDTIVL